MSREITLEINDGSKICFPFYVRPNRGFIRTENSLVLFFFKNCVGLSNDIKGYLISVGKFKDVKSNEAYLDPVDIKYIETIIRSYINKDEWETNGESVFAFVEIKELLEDAARNMHWLYRYLKTHKNCNVKYTDEA